jgi:hypothetical protein
MKSDVLVLNAQSIQALTLREAAIEKMRQAITAPSADQAIVDRYLHIHAHK